TITKTCENDGTAGAAGGATDGLTVGRASAGVKAGAVGIAAGVARATRVLRRKSTSGSLRSDPTAAGATTAAILAGLPPNTIIVGTTASTPAPMTMSALRPPGNRMTRLTRSDRAILRFGRCVTQRSSESICRVDTL